MVELFKDFGHPVLKSISALSRGFLKKKVTETPYTSMRVLPNTELLFRISSVLVWTIRLDRGRKGTRKTKRIRDHRGTDMCEITWSKTFGIHPKQVSGNSLGKTFRTSNRWPRQFDSQGFANLHRSGTPGITWDQFCREHTISRVSPQSRVVAVMSGGTIIGPVIEVRIVQILDQYGAWNCNSITKWYGLDILYYGFQRKESVREWSPYSQCRTQIQCRISQWTSKIWRRRVLLRKVKYQHPGDWCDQCLKLYWQQGNLCEHTQHSSYTSVPSHKKNHSYERQKVESYSCQFFVRRSSFNTGLQKWLRGLVRHYDQDNDNLMAQFIGTQIKGRYCWKRLQNMEHEISHEGSSMTRVEDCEDSTNSLAYFRAIQAHSGGIPSGPGLMGIFEFSYNWKKYFSQRLFVRHSIYPGEWTDSGWKGKRQRTADCLLHTTWPFGGDSVEEAPCDDNTVPQKVHYHSRWKRDSQPHDQRPTSNWKAVGNRSNSNSSSSQFVMTWPVQGDLYGRASLGQGTSEATQRMIKLVQGDLYEMLSQLLRKTDNSKLIFEWKEYLKMLFYKIKKRWKKSTNSWRSWKLDQAQNPFVTICQKVTWSSVENQVAQKPSPPRVRRTSCRTNFSTTI